MRIFEVEVENFCRWRKGKWVVEDGVMIVQGRNGAGKSSLYVESLVWGIYGSVWRGAGADDVIRDGEKDCRVCIVTDKGVLERVKVRGKGSVVKVDGKVVSEQEVRELVGISKDVFLNSVVFGSALSGMIFLSENERKEIVAEFIYSGVDKQLERVKEMGKEAQRELEYELRAEGDLRRRLEEIGRRITLLKGSVDNSVLREVEELERELVGIEKRVEELRRMLEKVRDVRERLRGRISDLRVEKGRLEEGIRRLKEDMEKERGRVALLEKGKGCPVCLREVDDECIDGVRREIERVVGELMRRKEEAEGKLLEKKEEEEKLLGKVREIEDVERQLMEKVREGERRRSEIVQRIRERRDDVEREREKVVQLEMLEKEKERVMEEIEEVVKRQREVGRIVRGSEWLGKVLVEYKTVLMDKVVEVLGEVANEILGRLTGRFSVDFGYEVKGKKRITEKFRLSVFDRGEEVDFRRLSGGEKRLVALGLNMALCKVMSEVYASDWNIVVFDEVFDGLDVVVREKVVDLLLDFYDKSVVVITHDDFSYREDEFKKVVIA